MSPERGDAAGGTSGLGSVLLTPSRRRAVTLGVLVAIFLAAIESTATATAMPTLVAELQGIAFYHWVASAYLLAFTVTIPLWGKASDVLGRRPTFLIGIAIFLTGCVACGLAPSMAFLAAARFFQGLGGGALMPIGMTIVGEVWEERSRSRLQGMFSGVYGLASVLGPVLGGLLTRYASWRWVFWSMVPFGLVAMATIAITLRELPRGRAAARPDLAGAASLSASLVTLLVALSLGGHAVPWGSPPMLALLAGSTVLLGVFLAVERRAHDPILALDLFRNPLFSAAGLVGLLSGIAFFGAVNFAPLFVQGVVGTGATGAGQVLTPLVLAWVLCSGLSGFLLLRTGPRPLVITGMASLTLSFLLLSSAGAEATWGGTAWRLALVGVGMGLSVAPLLIGIQATVPPERLGMATSANTFFRTIGGAIGTSLMGTVMSGRLHHGLESLGSAALRDVPGLRALVADPEAILDPIGRHGIPPLALAAVRNELAAAIHMVFVLGAFVSAAALLGALLVPRKPPVRTT